MIVSSILALAFALPASAQTIEGFQGLKAVREAAAAMKSAEGVQVAADCTGPIVLECAAQPGARLCRQLNQAKSLFDGGCNGEIQCIALWTRERDSLDGFSRSYIRDIPAVEKASEELGKLARSVAGAICDSSQTAGSADSLRVLSDLVYSMNSAMAHLKEIQQKAGVKPVRSCTISLGK